MLVVAAPRATLVAPQKQMPRNWPVHGAAENFAGFILGSEFQAAFVFSLLVIILVWRNFRLRLQRRYLK